jgi:hypothetical protein
MQQDDRRTNISDHSLHYVCLLNLGNTSNQPGSLTSKPRSITMVSLSGESDEAEYGAHANGK